MGIYISPGHIRHCYLTLSIGYSTFAFLTSALLQSSCFNQVASILNILDDELVRGVGNFISRLVSSGSSIFNFGTIPAWASFFIHVLSNSFRLYLGFIFCLSYLVCSMCHSSKLWNHFTFMFETFKCAFTELYMETWLHKKKFMVLNGWEQVLIPKLYHSHYICYASRA